MGMSAIDGAGGDWHIWEMPAQCAGDAKDAIAPAYSDDHQIGLFQGGLVPSYAIIVREYFSPQEAGVRVGIAMSATIVGMALGGWMGGVLFDMTGSYRAAFLNGIAWNVVNALIGWWLLARQGRRTGAAAA